MRVRAFYILPSSPTYVLAIVNSIVSTNESRAASQLNTTRIVQQQPSSSCSVDAWLSKRRVSDVALADATHPQAIHTILHSEVPAFTEVWAPRVFQLPIFHPGFVVDAVADEQYCVVDLGGVARCARNDAAFVCSRAGAA